MRVNETTTILKSQSSPLGAGAPYTKISGTNQGERQFRSYPIKNSAVLEVPLDRQPDCQMLDELRHFGGKETINCKAEWGKCSMSSFTIRPILRLLLLLCRLKNHDWWLFKVGWGV